MNTLWLSQHNKTKLGTLKVLQNILYIVVYIYTVLYIIYIYILLLYSIFLSI